LVQCSAVHPTELKNYNHTTVKASKLITDL